MAEQLLFNVADQLAQKSLELFEATGDEEIFAQVTKIIGSSSQTLEEAYKTAVRVRRAERRALEMLDAQLAALKD